MERRNRPRGRSDSRICEGVGSKTRGDYRLSLRPSQHGRKRERNSVSCWMEERRCSGRSVFRSRTRHATALKLTRRNRRRYINQLPEGPPCTSSPCLCGDGLLMPSVLFLKAEVKSLELRLRDDPPHRLSFPWALTRGRCSLGRPRQCTPCHREPISERARDWR